MIALTDRGLYFEAGDFYIDPWDAVDRAVIFGVEGPDHTWDDPAGALHTLQRIAAATEQSPEFRGRIPEGGLINGQPPDTSGPTIFEAVRNQLGLRLDRQKGPVDVIVIDHAEKPSEN